MLCSRGSQRPVSLGQRARRRVERDEVREGGRGQTSRALLAMARLEFVLNAVGIPFHATQGRDHPLFCIPIIT